MTRLGQRTKTFFTSIFGRIILVVADSANEVAYASDVEKSGVRVRLARTRLA